MNSPPASLVMADTIEASAFEIERPISSDRPDTRTTESANAISIHILTESRIAASACFGLLVAPLDAFAISTIRGSNPRNVFIMLASYSAICLAVSAQAANSF